MHDDDESIHLLLGQGRPSGAQRDRILEQVLRASVPRRQPRWRQWLALSALPTAAVAVVAIAFVVHPRDTDSAASSSLTAKGSTAGPAAALVLQAGCPGRPPGSCRTGDQLVFEVAGARQAGWLAAWAEGPGGARIWYFPAADGRLAAIAPDPGRAVLDQGARLGVEHPPGRYAVHLVALDAPADRAALLAGRAPARASAVVPLEIAP
jgi:hypothetical protein